MGHADTHKLCPSCGTAAVADAAFCSKCGHAYRTQFQPGQPPPTQSFTPPQAHPSGAQPNWTPPAYGPSSYSASALNLPPGQPLDWQLAELARRYRDANTVFVWTLVGGFLCLWPLWIISYLEYQKKADIKNKVAAMGVDVNYWLSSNRLS